jgi:hypothetical protein
MRSQFCLSVRVFPPVTFVQLADFCEMQMGGHTIETDLRGVLLNPVASIIPKLWVSNL